MSNMRMPALKLYAWCGLQYSATMTQQDRPRMSPEEFQDALSSLGWKQSDFCRRLELDKNTPSRWITGRTPIPRWVREYLHAMLAIAKLHGEFVEVHREPAGAEAADPAG